MRLLVVTRTPLAPSSFADRLRSYDPSFKIEVVSSLETLRETHASYDLVLVDAQPIDEWARACIREVAANEDAPRVVARVATEDEDRSVSLIACGASNLVTTAMRSAKVASVLQATLGERAVLDERTVLHVMDRLAEATSYCTDTDQALLDYGLSRREREVLRLLQRSLSNRQIADELFIEVGTVKNHVHRILEKLEVRTRQEAALKASSFMEKA